MDYHGDISAAVQYDSSTYLRWVDELETSLSPLAYHTTARTPFPEPQLDSQPTPGLLPMPGPSSQFGATSSMLSIPSLGAVDHEHNSSGLTPLDGDLPSPLYQTYPLAFSESATSFATCESAVDNDCYGVPTMDKMDLYYMVHLHLLYFPRLSNIGDSPAKLTPSHLYISQPGNCVDTLRVSNEMLPLLWCDQLLSFSHHMQPEQLPRTSAVCIPDSTGY